MHWLRHTYSTLAPRLGYLFWALHALILLGVSPWLVFAWSQGMMWTTQWGLVAAYTVLVAVVFAYARFSSSRVEFVFWPLLAIDCALVSWMIYLTGGIDSNHYLLFFAITPFIAFYQGLPAGVPAALAVSFGYLVVCVVLGGTSVLPDYSFRAVMIVIFTTAMGFASKFIRQSEGRLLNALDKLNERTSELERTHTHLQTIYETSRSLTELMSVDSVVDRLLGIARSVLDYPIFEIYTWNPSDRILSLNGRVDHLESTRLDKPRPTELTATMRRALDLGEVIPVRDRHEGRSIIDGNPDRSELIVPMVSEGKIVGLLSAKSPKASAFGEHDERILSILAASTAMSLVNADLHQRMEKLTIIDELTGVHNYRYFRIRLEDERRRTVRYGQPLSLVMVDIDWFKHLNDKHGHETGNVALRRLAQVINGCIRDVDILARYGGEEFIVILPQTGLSEARVIGERIRQQVEQAEFGVGADGLPLRLTVSIGISCYPENGRPEDELVETVDRALYHAKGKGRNLVCTT
jgi:diguanylate cyclase (GGDEF)-like protein